MFALLISVVLYAVSTPAPADLAFDEERAKRHYESFFYEFFKRDWGQQDSEQQLRKTTSRERPAMKLEAWPIDPARGAYCNASDKLGRFAWVGLGQSTWPTTRPATDLPCEALSDMSHSFMYGFKDHVAPDVCVERPGVTGGYQGAAACYFSVMAEYYNPSYWVALREVDGKVVIAGVLEHKEALEEPEKDKRLKPFLDAIEKRFGPPPEPKPAKPGKPNKAP
jgi:hypothetical protein